MLEFRSFRFLPPMGVSALTGQTRQHISETCPIPYDEGYILVEDLLGYVNIKGRGGTLLQPAVDLLERDPGFPGDAPLLVVTDGFCDRLTISRRHAFLLPEGGDLPFVPGGKVFRLMRTRYLSAPVRQASLPRPGGKLVPPARFVVW